MEIRITFPDGSVRTYEKGVNAYQIAMSISPRLAADVLAASVKPEDDDSADGPDIDDLVAHARKVLAKDKGTRILAEDVPALIQAELEYEAALEQDDEE